MEKDLTNHFIPQPEYHYFECQECGFDSVQLASFSGSEFCPLCLGDTGKEIKMTRREARSTDDPEGIDQRAGGRHHE